jgi:hypothetical protein
MQAAEFTTPFQGVPPTAAAGSDRLLLFLSRQRWHCRSFFAFFDAISGHWRQLAHGCLYWWPGDFNVFRTALITRHGANLAAMLRIAGPAVRSTAAIGTSYYPRTLQ